MRPAPVAADPAPEGQGSAVWIAVVALAGLALAARAGVPPAGALFGGGDAPTGAWTLAYSVGPVFTDGLATTRALSPEGARVWPLLDGMVLAPLLGALPLDVAWNVLVAVRIVAAGAGGALLLRRLGLHPAWGLLVAAPVATGLAFDLAWMPLGVALLVGRHGPDADHGASDRASVATGALAGLLWATHPAAAACGWLALATLAPARLRTRAAAAAAVVTGLAFAAWAWTLLDPLDPAAATAFRSLSPRADRDAGALIGLFGAGTRPWGSPLLLLALLPLVPALRTDLGRRAAALAGLGALVVLGPVLVVSDAPLALNGRTVPLPFLAVGWIPPLAAARDLVPAAILAWLGAAVAAATTFRERRAPLAALGLLVAAPIAGWAVPPDLPVATGPVLAYPPPTDGWPLYAAARDGAATSAGLGGAAPEGLLARIGRPGWSLADLRTWAAAEGFATMRVDTRAEDARAAEIALTVGEVAAVDAAWPDVHVQAWPTRVARPFAPPTRTVPPADDWAWRDPAFAGFLDPAFFDRARFRLRVYTSDDGATWIPGPPFAHSFTSLGLTVVGDDALVVSGTPGLTGWLAREFPQMDPAMLVAFTTADLATWGVRCWWLDPAVAAVDPQIDAGPDGLSVTAWLRTGPEGADPVALGGDHPVFTARLAPDGRFVPERPLLATPWLADPMRVGPWVYATALVPGEGHRVVVLGDGPGGWAERARLDGLSVPFVTRDATGFTMLAHGRDTTGSLTVVRLTSPDGLTWSAPVTLALPAGASCESPVAARFRGRDVLVCSERIGGQDI